VIREATALETLMHLIPHSIRQHLPLVKYKMNLIIADDYCHCTTKSYFCKIPVVFTNEKDTEIIRCHTFGFKQYDAIFMIININYFTNCAKL